MYHASRKDYIKLLPVLTEAFDYTMDFWRSGMMHLPPLLIRELDGMSPGIIMPNRMGSDIEIYCRNIYNFCFTVWGYNKEGFERCEQAAIARVKAKVDYLCGAANSKINYEHKLK